MNREMMISNLCEAGGEPDRLSEQLESPKIDFPVFLPYSERVPREIFATSGAA